MNMRLDLLVWRGTCAGLLVLALAATTLHCGSDVAPSGCDCADNGDCDNDEVCDASCLCRDKCEDNGDCPSYRPNCHPPSGLCHDPCVDNPDCPFPPNWPNCGGDGVCFGLCDEHADCTLPARPNCQLDNLLAYPGICLPPCAVNDDCESPLWPNCDPTPGYCLPLCITDDDCPEEFWKCDTDTGHCYLPECTEDSHCNPPDTVCEDFHCVPGCLQHTDCDPTERCDLVDPDNLNHCELRDCMTDADCSPPTTVCDTDGLVDPNGGGYCVPGCETFYDCRQLGYDCDPPSGGCELHDYGDIGDPCATGCQSGFCLTDHGNVCTDYCCIQHHCPPGWGCRTHDDGTGGGRTLDVCVPLPASQGEARYNETCGLDADCRSNICLQTTCRETCCVDGDCDQPFVSNMHCGMNFAGEGTACLEEPTTDNDPLGAPGCGTTGTPGDCRSNLCYSKLLLDTACSVDGDCPTSRPTCSDYPWGGTPNGINDCVRDFCVAHCCSSDDCPDYNGDIFFCGKIRYSPGDFNVCLLHEGNANLDEGAVCALGSDCRSHICSSTGGVCRKRCCTSGDCLDPAYSRCATEMATVLGSSRILNVCLP